MSVKITVDDRALKKLMKKLSNSRDMRVRVGVLASKGGAQKHPDGDVTMAELAAIHEFGVPKGSVTGKPNFRIPERSFLRRTFETNNSKRELAKIAGKVSKAMIERGMTADRALEVIGQWGSARVKRFIKGGDFEPLAESTVRRKKSRKPLIDKGHLLASINHEVVR